MIKIFKMSLCITLNKKKMLKHTIKLIIKKQKTLIILNKTKVIAFVTFLWHTQHSCEYISM